MIHIQKPYPPDPRYHVTTDGQVFSYCQKTVRVLKRNRRNLSGHLAVAVGRNNPVLVHRMVLETFVGSAPDGMVCRHLNGDPADNRLSNLAWGTRADNNRDKKWYGNPQKLTIAQIRTLKFLLLRASRHYTNNALAERFNVSHTTISRVRRGLLHGDVT